MQKKALAPPFKAMFLREMPPLVCILLKPMSRSIVVIAARTAARCLAESPGTFAIASSMWSASDSGGVLSGFFRAP